MRFGLFLPPWCTEKKRRFTVCLHFTLFTFFHHVDKCHTSKFWMILPLQLENQMNAKQCQSRRDSYICIFFQETTLCILDWFWKLQLVHLKSNLQHEQLAGVVICLYRCRWKQSNRHSRKQIRYVHFFYLINKVQGKLSTKKPHKTLMDKMETYSWPHLNHRILSYSKNTTWMFWMRHKANIFKFGFIYFHLVIFVTNKPWSTDTWFWTLPILLNSVCRAEAPVIPLVLVPLLFGLSRVWYQWSLFAF